MKAPRSQNVCDLVYTIIPWYFQHNTNMVIISGYYDNSILVESETLAKGKDEMRCIKMKDAQQK